MKTCFAVAALAAVLVPSAPPAQTPIYDGGLTCVVPVAELQRAIDWYRDRLGFRVDWQDDRMGFAELFTPVADVRIGLARMPDRAGSAGVVLTFGVVDIEAAQRALKEKGVAVEPIEEIPELVKLMTLKDADGNPLQLYQALAAPNPAQAGLEMCAFLAGSWVHVDGQSRLEEHWTSPVGGLAIGMSRGVKDGKAVFFEALRIEQTKDGVFYVASPGGRVETRFRLDEKATQPRHVVFVNPEHDFPKRISYQLAEDGGLHARIDDGTDGGRHRDFAWRRGSLR
ncbi:MAG: VOC family protein [Planctomycetes bacterium]|nr:VOC family protein [Planctomycetota bacterium]